MEFIKSAILVLVISSVFVTESLGQCPITVDAGEDIYLCAPPSPAQLNASIDGDYLNFMWSPLTGMTGSTTLSPTVTVSQTTTYYLKARAVDQNSNLIVNGDFESGNFGFTSDYIESPGNLVPEGVYEVLPNPQVSHPGFAPCEDHTSGSGNMMAVNGAGTPGLNVWCQTISVQPNTEYAFSAWVTSLVAASPALLQFSINGQPIGGIFNAPSQTCNWQNFYSIWNSGSNGSATICIVNQNTTLGGNDFALDDLVFSPICEVTDSVTVHVVNINAFASPAISYIPCAGSTLTLNGNGSSVGPDITYYWDTPNGNIVSGETTLNPVVDQAGTYTLTVTFDNGLVNCTKTATVSVLESPNPLFAWIIPGGQLGCNAPSITLIGNSNQPAFSSYSWTTLDGNIVSGANLKNCVVDEPGTYFLEVTNTSTGCIATAEITITEATDPPTAVATASDSVFNCFTLSILLDTTGSTQGANISYAWTAFDGGSLICCADQPTAPAGSPGLYVLTVTNNNNGCTDTDTVLIASNIVPPLVDIQTPDTFSCALDTLVLSGMVNPGHVQAAWTASNGGMISGDTTQLNITILAPGTYILGVLDTTNFCYGADTVVVTIDTIRPLAVIQPPDTITCQQSSISLSGAGSTTGSEIIYQWTAGSGGNIVSGDTSLNPVVNAAGNYLLVVTNLHNGCTDEATTTVPADANAITAVANAPDSLSCIVGQIILNSNGSSNGATLEYAWTTVDGSILSGADSPNPVVDAPGTYQLVITNTANGCTATDIAVAVLNTATPNLQATAPGLLTCSNPTQTIQAQNNGPAGPYQYVWTSTNGGNILSGDSTLSPEVNTPGTYTLVALHLDSGCTDTLSVTVALAPGTPAAVVMAADTLTCQAPVQTLDGGSSSTGAAFQYNWTAVDGGTILNGGTTLFPEISTAGTYILVVTNSATGCTATDSIQVAANQLFPPADAGNNGLLTCDQTVFLLTANPGQNNAGLLFQWTALTNGNLISPPDSIQVACDAAGLYQVMVTNPANGCTALDTVSVVSNQVPPSLSIVPADKLTCIVTSLSLQAQASGTGPALDYLWETSNGLLLNGANTPMPLIGQAGAYTVTVTDPANACTSAQTVLVSIDTIAPQLNLAVPEVLTCLITQVQLNAAAQPVSGILAAWSTPNGNIVSGGNTLTPTLDEPGAYMLQVTNTANGCTAATSTIVQQNILPPVTVAGANDTLNCGLTSLTLSGTANGQGTLNYTWTAGNGGNILSGANTPMPVINAAGLYVLEVTDSANGCAASDTLSIFNDANAPQADAGPPGILTCSVLQINLQGAGSIGPNFNYVWTGPGIVNGSSTLTPLVNAPGQYLLAVTNLSNGCTSTAAVTIGQDIAPPQAEAGPQQSLDCLHPQVTLEGSAQSAGPASFVWTTTNGSILSGTGSAAPVVNAPGQYTLLVTNTANGCTDTDIASVDEVPPPVLTAQLAQPDCHDEKGEILLSVQSGGVPPFAWSFDGGQVFQNTPLRGSLDPGTYTVLVRDQLGCLDQMTATIDPPFLPTLDLPLWLEIELGDSIRLQPVTNIPPGSVASWTWTPADGLSCTDCPRPWAQPFRFNRYSLTVTDLNGCTATASVSIRVDRSRNIYAPNIISANADGLNDRFTIYGRTLIDISSLQVFDRWGNLVFNGEHLEPGDESEGWDGSFRGQELGPGVYVWQAVVLFVDGEELVLAGDVTIMR